MYLVDTSTWLNLLRNRSSAKVEILRQLLTRDAHVQICGIIYQEILQGAHSAEDLELLKTYFGAQAFCSEPCLDTYAAAAELYARLRWKGITIRSSSDCVIARLAIEQELILLHDDADFDRIAQLESRLKLG